MINLEQISHNIDNILNRNNGETSAVTFPTILQNAQFLVATEGLHFDKVYDMNSGKNLFPVFVGTLGGEFNAVKDLEEADLSIPVAIYFPIRFKEAFYQLQDFLMKCFVGQIHTWGYQKAVSNITPCQYGEIQQLDLKQFKDWVNENYNKLPISVMEMWGSLTFTLYLSTAKNMGAYGGYMVGNDCEITELSYTNDNDTYTDDAPTFVQTTDGMNSQPAAQQLLGERVTKGFASSSQYSFSLPVYVKNTEFYKAIISDIKNRTIQNTKLSITETIHFKDADDEDDDVTITNTYYISNATLVKAKGTFLVIGFALADLLE